MLGRDHADDSSASALAAGLGATTSSTVNTKLRKDVAPVLTRESALEDDLGLTGLTSGAAAPAGGPMA